MKSTLRTPSVLLGIALLASGCGEDSASGLPVLGDGSHKIDSVVLSVIGTSEDGLNLPRDLAFNPIRPNELWVVSRADHSTQVFFDTGTSAQTSRSFWSPSGEHFLAHPSSLAFNDNGFFATSHESDVPTQGGATPGEFMGPTLWTSDLDIFDAGHGGHMDMLHNSPNGMGVEWAGDGNSFWIYDGFHNCVTLYQFNADHGPGGSDHSDAVVFRYLDAQLGYEPDVPSHMVRDVDGMLYIADTANNRVVRLDTNSGTPGDTIFPNYDGTSQRHMDDAQAWNFLDGNIQEMQKPSGIALRDGILYVGDNATGRITAFDVVERKRLDWLDTGLPMGSLMGLALDAAGNIYVADALQDQILRIAAP